MIHRRALAVALFSPLLLAMSPTAEIPKLLHYRDVNRLAWISESEAFDKDGKLRAELFGPYSDSMKRHMQRNGDGTCHEFMTQAVPERPYTDTTLAEAAVTARSVITGRVVNVGRGFYEALPGTLVSVRVANDLTRPKASERLDRNFVFIFIPVATFVTPEGALCSEPFTKLRLPEVGDQVMAFSYDSSNVESGVILPTHADRELIVERNGARVITPQQWKKDLAAMRLDDIATYVRRYASQRPREK